MSIVFDARWIGPEMSGIGRYSLGVLAGLGELADDSIRVTVLGGDRDQISILPGAADRFDFLPLDLPPMSPISQVKLPPLLKRCGARLYHAPYVHAPYLARSCRMVITVHDLIPQRISSELDRSKKVKHRRLWAKWCQAQYRRADAIATVSEHSRRELIEFAGVPAAKVTRIYNGVSPQPGPPDAAQSFRDKFHIKGPIVSYIGRHDPYKNITGLVRAFARAQEMKPDDSTLVIGGKLDPRYPEAGEIARTLGIAHQVLFTDYIDDDHRLGLLRASRVFVFPSKYEGFGLPPLEAFIEGVPVVCSNATSLPEVVGDAATVVDPDYIDGMAGAIVALMHDEELRERRIKAGYKQAAKFTWKHSAEQHWALYNRVLGEESSTRVVARPAPVMATDDAA